MSERITLEESHPAGYPVVKRVALNQTFKGAIVKSESRDRLKRGDDGQMRPIIKDNGRHAQEMVVTCITLPGTDMPAGLGEEESVPAPGDIVRMILKGKSFGDWIDQKKLLPDGTVAVGDVITQTTTIAQVYDANGNASGGEIRDQAAVVEARQRGRSVGIYGPLTLSLPTDDSWTQKAIEAYRKMQSRPSAESDQTSGYPGGAGSGTPDPWGSAPPATQSVGATPTSAYTKPSSISQAAWDGMDEATRKVVAASVPGGSSDEPPF